MILFLNDYNNPITSAFMQTSKKLLCWHTDLVTMILLGSALAGRGLIVYLTHELKK